MKNYLFVIMLIILSSNIKAQINVPIDINEGITNSNIGVEHTTFDIGSINNVFDSNYGTLVRSANINPLVITLEFENPMNFIASKLLTTEGNGNWILETADNINDLNNQTGSYVIIINRTVQAGVVDSIGFDEQVGTFLRLTLNRTTGDNYVHLNEWQIITEANIDELRFSNAQNNAFFIAGQRKLIVFGQDNTLNIDFLVPNDLLIWTSTNTDVATVNSEGVVLGISEGITTIEAEYNSISITKDIVVIPTSVVEEEIDIYLSEPATNSMEEIPVIILRYLPTTNGINLDVSQATDWGSLGEITLDDLISNIDNYDKRVKFSLEEGSRFHGYENNGANSYLGYKVVKYLTVLRQIYASDISNGEEEGVTVYMPDYKREFDELELSGFINDNNIKEVWIWQGQAALPHWPSYDPEIHGDIEKYIQAAESNMSSPTTGDISNSFRQPDDLYILDHTYVVYGQNIRRTQAEAVHNHGHQLECMYNYAAEQQDGTNAMFLENFCGWGPNYTVPPIGRAGDTHHPPNTDVDYDYLNTTFGESDIMDWNPSGGTVTSVNCNTWGDLEYNWPGSSEVLQKIESQWYIFWFQNMPGYNNQIPYNSYFMTNWWQFVSDWDLSNNNNIGLYGNYTVADFTADNLAPSIVETVNFTDLSTNTPTSWLWTFAPSTITYMNGAAADSQHPEIRFDNPGLYTVELTVTNADGSDAETKADYINATNPPPVADFIADNLTPSIVETVNFTDLSTNTPTSWLWTFTPGTITYMNGTTADSQHPEVRFDNPGLYTVELAVTNADGSDTETKADYINAIGLPPVADFIADNLTPSIVETVNFTDLSTNTPTSWLWTFTPSTITYMNGTAANSQHPEVRFDNPGLYTVELTVTNTGGTDTEIKADYISAIGLPPVADFIADNLAPNIVETVNFSDLSTNTPTSWLWTFTPSTVTYMNGTTSGSQHPEVRFDNTSYYTVSLTATNDYGFDTETKTDYITVTDPPPDADFVADNTTPLVDETVIFTDLSTNDPTSWLWTFSPSTVTYMSGTDQNSQTPQVQFDEIGLYTVELTATNAGGSDTEIKTGYINVGGAFAVIVTATPEEICIGNSSQLEAFPSGGSGTYTFLWTSEPPGYNSTDQNPIVYPLVTTMYTIEVNDGSQSIFDNVTVTLNPQPVISLGNWPEILCNQQEPPVQLTATPTGGIFNGAAVSPDGLFSPEEAPLGWSVISYTYENQFGCEAMEFDSIFVDNCVGIFKPELEKMTMVTFPNPFTTFTTFEYELKRPERVSLSIYDYSGKQLEIIQKNQQQGKQNLIWNSDSYSSGIYYYSLQVGNAVANGKMVKIQ